MPPELLAQFPIAEAAVEALGIVLWPMVEFEADDAIGAAAVAVRAEDPRVERILVCTPDKDMAQLVVGERVVLWDRRRAIVYDEAGVRAKWGVPPTSIPDWLGLVGDSSDGFPGHPRLGREVGRRRARRYGHYEDIPPKASAWEVPGVGGARAMTLAAIAARPLGRGAAVPRPGPPALGGGRRPRSASTTRRAALGRDAARRLGGVLRGMGPGPPADQPHRWLATEG